MKEYSDERIRLVYPAAYKLQAAPASGQYFFRNTKNKVLTMSVVAKGLMDGVFASLVAAPPPGADRKKTVHHDYVLGGKRGRAIVWDIFDPDGKLFMKGLEFFCEVGEWSVLAKLDVRPPAELRELEDIVASLQANRRAI